MTKRKKKTGRLTGTTVPTRFIGTVKAKAANTAARKKQNHLHRGRKQVGKRAKRREARRKDHLPTSPATEI